MTQRTAVFVLSATAKNAVVGRQLKMTLENTQRTLVRIANS